MKSIKKIILGVTALVATLCFISCKPEPEPEPVTEVAKYCYSVSSITFYSNGAFVYEISSGSTTGKGKGTYSGSLSKNGDLTMKVTEIESTGQTVENKNDAVKLSATITENGEVLNLKMNGFSVGKFTKNKNSGNSNSNPSDNQGNNNSSNTNNPDNSDNTTVIIPDNSNEGVTFPVVYKLSSSIKLTFFKDKTFTYEQTGITLNGTYSGDLSKNGEIKMNVKNTSTATTYKLAATISDNGETLNLTFTQIVHGMEASVPNTLIRQ